MGKFTIAMKFTKRPSASPRGFGLVWEGGINKAEGLDVGPLSASSEGDPQYPQKKEGK
jgi:hypothetical protein